MAYAAEGRISQSPIKGGIEISAEQYAAALDGMLDGKIVTIAGGFAVIDPPKPEPEIEPEEPRVPASVTPAQAKLALYDAGLFDDVDALVMNYPYRPVSIWWTSALAFHRDHAYLNAIGIELGLSDEQIDTLFIAAGAR